MRGASVHFKPVKSAAHAVAHSARTVPPTYLLPSDASIGTFRLTRFNKYDVAAVHASKLAMASRQALREKNYSPVWEGVINLPSPDGAPEAYKSKCANSVSDWCDAYEKITGHKVLRADIHLDEGHVDETGKVEFNAHAHVFVDRTNDLGRVIKVDAPKLRKVQDMTAKITGLERGDNALKTGRKHVPHQQFKAQAETVKNLVEKEKAEAELMGRLVDKGHDQIKTLKAEIAELKQQYASERAKLKASGLALQADYQKLKAKHELALAELAKAKDELANAQTVKPVLHPAQVEPPPLTLAQAQDRAIRAEEKRLGRKLARLSDEAVAIRKMARLEWEGKATHPVEAQPEPKQLVEVRLMKPPKGRGGR